MLIIMIIMLKLLSLLGHGTKAQKPGTVLALRGLLSSFLSLCNSTFFYFFHYLVHSESHHVKGRIFMAMLIFTKAEDADHPSALKRGAEHPSSSFL